MYPFIPNLYEESGLRTVSSLRRSPLGGAATDSAAFTSTSPSLRPEIHGAGREESESDRDRGREKELVRDFKGGSWTDWGRVGRECLGVPRAKAVNYCIWKVAYEVLERLREGE